MTSARPQISEQNLEQLAHHWDKGASLTNRLAGYSDINALMTSRASGRQFVLKVRLLSEGSRVAAGTTIETETDAMDRAISAGVPVPEVLATSSGSRIVAVDDDQGQPCAARALAFLPGQTLAGTIHTSELMGHLGRALGTLTRALQGFEPTTLSSCEVWDLDNGTQMINERRDALTDDQLCIVDAVVADHDHRLCTLAPLPRSVIHGDANDYNILVGYPPADDQGPYAGFEPNRITGLIDFGDLHRSSTVNEIAIATAYAMFGNSREHADDPVGLVLPLVAAYNDEHRLSDAEIQALFPKALLRLAVSASASAKNRQQTTSDSYRSISETDAWRTLRRFVSTTDTAAERRAKLRRIEWRLRYACGLEPVPGAANLTTAIAQLPVAPVIAAEHRDYQLIDLSFDSTTLVGYDSANEAALTQEVSAALGYSVDRPEALRAGEAVGWGRFAEPRALYVGAQFRGVAGAQAVEPRTVHIGVDLFAPPTTPIYAPLAGIVHSFADNAFNNDYGPTILLEHTLEDRRFLTLYGHLSRASLEGLEVGQTFAAGEKLAELGTARVNGGWTPHLHFQIILDDLGLQGNYPGVAEASQLGIWKQACPDPNLLLRWDDPASRDHFSESTELEERRKSVLAPSLSLSYHRPLDISLGRGQYLYERNGHCYLDLVNNVSHVGHCNPTVVAAIARQAAALNTNSRYLHRNIVDYAERLLATMPEPIDGDPLEVCFLVNSGSEANDLALRIARTATGRSSVICMDGAYHGNVTSAIAVSPYKHDGPGGSGTPADVFKVSMPDTYRGLHRDQDAADLYAREVRRVTEEHTVAAFIGESILSCGGQIELPSGYLAQAYEAVRATGGVAMADEVQVGFGRTGSHFWGFESHGVTPDIVTLGKPIGNGHPLAAVITTRKLASAFANGMEYFNTYGGNPVSCAVGLAVLDVIETEELQQRALELGAHFKDGLGQIATFASSIGHVRGRGLFLGFELVQDRTTRIPDPQLASYLVQWMRERGFLLSTDGPDHNVIKIKPPMVIERHDIDDTLGELENFFRIIDPRATMPR